MTNSTEPTWWKGYITRSFHEKKGFNPAMVELLENRLKDAVEELMEKRSKEPINIASLKDKYKAKIEQHYSIVNNGQMPYIEIVNRTTITVDDARGNCFSISPELAKYIHRLFTLINP